MNEKKARIPEAVIESTKAIDDTILVRELQREGESDMVEEISAYLSKFAPRQNIGHRKN
ncbi:MAG: hypothetical protein LUQ22_09090 [Methanotrichaceae archaeon]|nr:hypothetical protein [Methanotrichaceae archaeon]